MDTSLSEFRAAVLEASLELLWRQWCGLGVAGHAEPMTDGRLIDPEALLLATTSLGRHEPRLFEEALDWLSQYGSLLNLQRLKNLQSATGLGDAAVLAAVGEWLAARSGQPRWKAVAGFAGPTKVEPAEPLHLGSKDWDSDALDPVFLRHGLQRRLFEPRGMSRAPDPALPSNLVTTLRALIGVSARVEVILLLAGGRAEHASEIARAAGYAPRTLQALLQEMTLSGRLLSQEPAGRGGKIRRGAHRRYQLRAGDWSFLTNGGPAPAWFPWAAVFRLALGVVRAVPAPGESHKHAVLVSSKLRAAAAASGQDLSSAGLLSELDLRAGVSGDELTRTLAARLPAFLRSL